MKPSFTSLLLLLSLAHAAHANVEKTIFLGPQPETIPSQPPSLDTLRLDVLEPGSWSVRTHVAAEFPRAGAEGKATWLLLDNLAAGQRYEVRICWAATVRVDRRCANRELTGPLKAAHGL